MDQLIEALAAMGSASGSRCSEPVREGSDQFQHAAVGVGGVVQIVSRYPDHIRLIYASYMLG
jgi:hypothetical protein